MPDFSHRDYFRCFRLNVEQYGEILVAQAFRGTKMGDEQVGYDVKVANSEFVNVLSTAGISFGQNAACVSDDEIRIEVKSKISYKAEVVGLRETKLFGLERGGRKHLGMTHLAVVLVCPGSRKSRDPQEEGLIADAWLLPRDLAIDMRNKTTRKGKSLSVKEIRAAMAGDCRMIDIKPLLESVAQAPLLGMLERVQAQHRSK